jgi:hypothetical protein
MKHTLIIILFIFAFSALPAQEKQSDTEGKVTYMTSQNIYVKFPTTNGLKEGDSLYDMSSGSRKAVLRVMSLSSTSCVCTPLNDAQIKLNQIIVSDRIRPKTSQTGAEVPLVVPVTPAQASITPTDSVTDEKKKEAGRRENIRGRISLASYTDLSNMTDNTQRTRLGFSLNAKNIRGSKLSGETYLSFYVKDDGWEDIKENVMNGLKIYNLAVKYDFNEKYTAWFGRKINPLISNLGAIDGVQGERRGKTLTTGIVAGFRPDYADYGFNAKLLQFGAYASHNLKLGKNTMQNTLAFFEQTNTGRTDRRFFYFQHGSRWFRDLNFFASAEIDIYSKVNDVVDNSPALTNLYLSLRYQANSKLGLSLSYSDRQSIIYYETFDTGIINKLLGMDATRGFLFQAHYQVLKKLTLGVNAGYREQKSDLSASWNAYGYMTYRDIPWLHVDATLSYTSLAASYLSGNILSLGLSRDIIPGRLNLALTYRYINYDYIYSDSKELQNIAEVNLDLRIYKKLSMAAYYEGTFSETDQHNRIYLQLNQRF